MHAQSANRDPISTKSHVGFYLIFKPYPQRLQHMCIVVDQAAYNATHLCTTKHDVCSRPTSSVNLILFTHHPIDTCFLRTLIVYHLAPGQSGLCRRVEIPRWGHWTMIYRLEVHCRQRVEKARPTSKFLLRIYIVASSLDQCHNVFDKLSYGVHGHRTDCLAGLDSVLFWTAVCKLVLQSSKSSDYTAKAKPLGLVTVVLSLLYWFGY
jgi:hypothetical protein